MKSSHLASITRSTLIACTLMIGTLAATHSASAQSPEALATVNIPFTFHMGDQTMPAGMYRIDLVSNHVVKLQGPDHAVGSAAMHSATKLDASDHGIIVFDPYGENYFLRQIWTAGNKDGLEAGQTRVEKNTLQANDRKTQSSTQLAFNPTPRQ
jgi:hypothetical protein